MNAHRLIIPAASLAVVVGLAAVSFGGPPAPDKTKTQPSATAAPTPQPLAAISAAERARRGVVVVEKAGHPVGLGVVLANDGRILSTLSPLGDGNGLDVRFADNSVVDVRVGHSDRTWDLSLLVPQVGKWPEGLNATTADPLRAGSQVKSFTQVRGKAVTASLVLKGRNSFTGGDGQMLRDALEIATRVAPTDLGAPIVDDQGQVLGLISKACGKNQPDGKPCQTVPYGAPVEALRQFLRSAPPNAIPPAPWLGIQGTAGTSPYARGVRVVVVHPESPADEVGLRGGAEQSADMIVSLDGTPVETPEKLADVVRRRAVGDRVQLIVLRENKYRVTTITLRPAPNRGSPQSPVRR